MYQVIPENISQILFKRLLIFICFMFAALFLVHKLQARTGSYQPVQTTTAGEINKATTVFTLLEVQ